MSEIDDEKYIDVLNETPELISGVPDIALTGSFNLFSRKTHNEFRTANNFVDNQAVKDFSYLSENTSGCILRFKTTASVIKIHAVVQYARSLLKVTQTAASGFDLYKKYNNTYYHMTVFNAAKNSKNVDFEFFSEKQFTYILYFPLYDCVEELKICAIDGVITPDENFSNQRPIAFYGNSITQGASASRSGNAFCNIVSRKLDIPVVNYSISSYCKGNISVAQTIGKFNYSAIVIDYSRNAFSDHSFELTYDKFYMELRKYHPNIPIVLLTPINLSKQIGLYRFDEIIKNTFNSALERNEKIIFIDVNSLFDEDEADLVTVDTGHMSDYGMFRVGNKIAEELNVFEIKNVN